MELSEEQRKRVFKVYPNMRGTLVRDEMGAMIAKGAVVIGDVLLGKDVNIWFTCVLRGDDEPICIGEGTNVQDGTVIHVDIGHPCRIGKNVTIGHKAMIHGCEIGDHALIGMGAIVLTAVEIGAYAIVAAGALVPEGMLVPPRTLVMGMPAKIQRDVSDAEAKEAQWRASHYIERAKAYL